jgi:hypothetical protein
MTKIDFKKQLKHLYQPSSKAFAVVDVPPLQFLMIDGSGDPNSDPAYAAAVEALYAVAYRLKFLSKQALGQDYTVMPLEGLWWAEDMATFAGARDKSRWQWTMMIMQPDWIASDHYATACADVARKKNPVALPLMRFETYAEGLALQILHIGSYDDEAPTLARLHSEVMPAQGFTFNGKHHEIYLSDPRRVAAEKLKTVLRQPVRST